MPKPHSFFSSFPPRSSHKQELVPTIRARPSRDRGKYESGELPSLDLLLDRALNDIEHLYNSRGRSRRSFDSYWKSVCKDLRVKKNATAFEHWKRASTIKNHHELVALEKDKCAVLARLSSPERQADPILRQKDLEADKEVEHKIGNFKPKVKVTTEGILAIAAAYWIEAMNARNSGDELRALHALIECYTNIGATLSTKTEAEAKGEAGAKQGKRIRDAFANHAATVLTKMEVDRHMAEPTFLLDCVVQQMQRDPSQAKVLVAYNSHVTAGKKNEGAMAERLADKLLAWATRGDSPYPKLQIAFRDAQRRAEQKKNSRRTK